LPHTTEHLTLPDVGFGTYRLNGADGVETISRALQGGYRLIDSAFNYENEGAVGAAVRSGVVPREEVIVTSKLPGRHHAHDQALACIEESVYRTGLDHLDLYLIHWPNPARDQYVEAWQALIEARSRGLVREIGVSNFLPEHIDRLITETGVTPAVNQIELHPYFPQADQRAYDTAHGIVTQAWSPLGRANSLFTEPVLTEIAAAHGVGVPAVILAWHARLGVLPIPKASSPDRQRQNLEAATIELSDAEMDAVATLARPDGRNKGQDPAVVEQL